MYTLLIKKKEMNYYQDLTFENRMSEFATGLNFILDFFQIRSIYFITASKKQVLFSFSCINGERDPVLQDFLERFPVCFLIVFLEYFTFFPT